MKTKTSKTDFETLYGKFKTWYNLSRFPKNLKDLGLHDLKEFISYCSFCQRKQESEIFQEMKEMDLLDEEQIEFFGMEF